jgi:hypothetical protein
MTPNDLLASGYRMGRQLIHALVDDLPASEFQHQPVPGANCAAWIIGHLAITARRTAERLGATGLPELTEEFVGRFRATKKAAGDQSGFGEKAELLNLLDVCVDKLIGAVLALPPAALANPPASPGTFATNSGESMLFGALHFTFHAGQLSTIRRSLGKPPVI